MARLTLRESMFLLLLALAGAAAFFGLFSRLAPTARLELEINRREALQLARAYVRSLSYEVAGFDHNTTLFVDNRQESYLQAQRAGAHIRAQLENHHPIASWHVLFRHPEQNERFELRLSPRGEVHHFEHILPAHAAGPPFASEKAKALVETFLQERHGLALAEYDLIDLQFLKHEARTEYVFKWEKRNAESNEVKWRLWAKVIGDRLGGWGREAQLPQAFDQLYQQRHSVGQIFDLCKQILILSVFVISIIVFVLKFHAGEVSVRNALLFAAVSFFCILLHTANALPGHEISQLPLIEDNRGFFLFITYFVLGAIALAPTVGLFLVWAGGESLTRELWPHKLKTFDGFFSGRVVFRELGLGVLTGLVLALALLGVRSLAVNILADRPGVWLLVTTLSEPPGEQQALSAHVPALFPLGSGIYHALYLISYAALFALALLKRHVKHIAVAVAITLLTFDLLFTDAVLIYPRWLQAGVGILGGLIIYGFYLRYDLMTITSGVVFYYALPLSLSYVLQPDRTYQISGWASLGTLGLLAIIACVIAVRGRAIEEQEVAPRYVRNITERERMKMELDIARKAQLRMLPQDIPRFSGLDIAALCEPAKEVGGDYFDFVFFGNQRLGIVIGDVSGKGMPAALYMTLTKGFLQAQALSGATPHEILCRMNRNFFQTAERNIFVSLFFAVIDPAGRTMTYARAGHNPTIVRRTRQRRTQWLQPTGIALGLEKGAVFERILQQESVTLESGDALIFYTDGLTEGMNRSREEFGERRLLEVISPGEEKTAQELLDRIHAEYRTFVGREEQHDDLTCVVVKVV